MSSMTNDYAFQVRRGNKLIDSDGNVVQNDWAAYESEENHVNPLEGELVAEFRNGRPVVKMGDGVTPFSELPELTPDMDWESGAIKNAPAIQSGEGTNSIKTISPTAESANIATGTSSLALGVKNLCGARAFTINAMDATSNTYTLDSVEGLEVGDVYSVHIQYADMQDISGIGNTILEVFGRQAENVGQIVAIDTNTQQVTVDVFFNYPAIEQEDPTFWRQFLPLDPNEPLADELGIDHEVNTFRIVSKPDVGTRQIGDVTTTIGTGNQALSKNAFAEGYYTLAQGSHSHTEGYATTAIYSAHAEGKYSSAMGQMSHAEGDNTLAAALRSHAEGYRSVTEFADVTGVTRLTGAHGDVSHTQGLNTTTEGRFAHAEGYYTTAAHDAAHAEGSRTVATGNHAHAEGNKTVASGDDAHAEGRETKALGTNSHAEGQNTTATGNNSHAQGYNTHAEKDFSHAEGYYTTASHSAAHAEGSRTVASGNHGHAEGQWTTASGEDAHAEGYYSKAEGLRAHAEGDNTLSRGKGSHAEGGKTTESFSVTIDYLNDNKITYGPYETGSLNTYTHSEGKDTSAGSTYAHAEGERTIALGAASHAEGVETIVPLLMKVDADGNETPDPSLTRAAHAEGHKTVASNIFAHAEGYITIASGESSHSEGSRTTASGKHSHAEGHSTTSYGEDSHAEGREVLASGLYSHAEGYITIASGQAGHAEGSRTEASGNHSHAEGHSTSAAGQDSHAEGYKSKVTLIDNNSEYSKGAHAEGYETEARGWGAHAEGRSTLASADDTHAEGAWTKAEGAQSHAEGSNTVSIGCASHAENAFAKSTGDYSHAEGWYTESYGKGSHAQGRNSSARGEYSHAAGYYSVTTVNAEASSALGYYTSATAQAQTAVGKYNATNDDALFLVGNGTGNSQSARSNAFEVMLDGTARVQSTNGEDENSVVNIKYFRENTSTVPEIDLTNYATLDYVHASGSNTTASGVNATAEGTGSIAAGKDSHAEGAKTVASYNDATGTARVPGAYGEQSHSEGINTRAESNFTHAEGNATTAIGLGSHAEGHYSTTTADYAHAEGERTLASGKHSHAEGHLTIAAGNDSHAEGCETKVPLVDNNPELTRGAHAEGLWTTASGHGSHAEGNSTLASKESAHAEGCQTKAEGYYSHAEGYQTVASGTAAHAEGARTVTSYVDGQGVTRVPEAAGNHSHTQGINTRAEGQYSHAEGNASTALAKGSHAEGHYTVTDGEYAHAEGEYAFAKGLHSHAEGHYTVASGKDSHAEGRFSIASGDYSHAGGMYTIASGSAQTAVGKYNVEDTNALLIVGNGTESLRSNAFTVNKNGYATVKSVNKSDNTSIVNVGHLNETLNNVPTTDYIDFQIQQISANVAAHNSSNDAHTDIRGLINELRTSLNELVNASDEELAQVIEMIEYAKANETLVDSITTSKVSVTDIVDNLTTNVTNKPLSAAQGVALKTAIDAINVPTRLSQLSEDATHRVITDAERTNWNAKANASDIPIVPTKLSAFTNDNGYVTEESLHGRGGQIALDTQGTNITLTDATNNPLRGLTITGMSRNTIGKNLLPFPYTSGNTTINGVTFTTTSEGKVKAVGTPSSQFAYTLGNVTLGAGIYIIGLVAEGNEGVSRSLVVRDSNGIDLTDEINTSDYQSFWLSSTQEVQIIFKTPWISAGDYLDCTYSFMLEKVADSNATPSAWEPYISRIDKAAVKVTVTNIDGTYIHNLSVDTPEGLLQFGGKYDEIDLAAGSYTKRIQVVDGVYSALETPVVTYLTPAKVAEYKALRTYRIGTNIVNDADAVMKLSYITDTKSYIDMKFAELENRIKNL